MMISLLLLLSLLAGGVLAYWQAVNRINVEMSSALLVAQGSVRDALPRLMDSKDPESVARSMVAAFDGDRHIRAQWLASDGRVLATSQVRAPADPPPRFLRHALGAPREALTTPMAGPAAPLGLLIVNADPLNEIAEIWGDAKLKFGIIGGFCALVLALTYVTLGRALRPLENLSAALAQVGLGDYRAKVAEDGPQELSHIYKAFNSMAARLHAAEVQNRRLNEQLSTVQDEERTDIARDLHDEIGPFLFAVDVDAQSIGPLIDRGAVQEAAARSAAIRQSVGHMQTHLRGVLSRLKAPTLLDLGLRPAAEQLIQFWQARRPDVTFDTDITDERFSEPCERVAFRILQEGLSNAIRHGKPSAVHLRVQMLPGNKVEVSVSDDGQGLAAESRRGFGLTGMEERVNISGGSLLVSAGDNGRGVRLCARLPAQRPTHSHHPEPTEDRRTI